MKKVWKAAFAILLVAMVVMLAACGSNGGGTNDVNDGDTGTDITSTNDNATDETEAEEEAEATEEADAEEAEATEEADAEEEADTTEEEAVEETGETATDNADTDIVVQTINVGTMGTYNPFTFTDDDNNLTGYDIEVVRLLDERIPDVDFEFIMSPWDSLFMGLDSERYDMVANQIAKTPEREEKYLFTDSGYIYAQSQLVVHTDDDARTSLADFEGETLGGITGDYFTEMMEEYNEANGNPYKMQYYGEDYTSIFIDLDSGRIAATLNDSTVVSYTEKTLGLNIKCVGDVLEESYSYFVFRNDETGRDLKDKVDKAMEEIVADGSLKALSIEWFGEDYTQ